jgi:hypothetical protein
MVGQIIALISCLMCAFPFWIIAKYNKDDKEPIGFWTGDESLKSKVKDVPGYNAEMALLYKRYGTIFAVTGIAFVLYSIAGIVLLCLDCTLGIYLVYRQYKRILKSYS